MCEQLGDAWRQQGVAGMVKRERSQSRWVDGVYVRSHHVTPGRWRRPAPKAGVEHCQSDQFFARGKLL